MSNQYLDNNGLAYLWNKIKAKLSNKLDTETFNTAWGQATSAMDEMGMAVSNNSLNIANLSLSKQDSLTAGENITISGNTISSTGGFSGNYNDLTNKPTIPTKTSQLTNNSGFITSLPFTVDGSGNISVPNYLAATWLQSTANNHLTSASQQIAVQNNGWIYYRTLDEMRSDLGIGAYVTGFKKSNNGTWYARTWSNGVIECWSKNNSISGPTSWSSFGSGLYRGDRVVTFDFATFSDLYSHEVTCAGSAGSGYTGILNVIPTNTQLTVRLLRNSSSTSNYNVSLRMYLIGKGTLKDSYGWTNI